MKQHSKVKYLGTLMVETMSGKAMALYVLCIKLAKNLSVVKMIF